MSKTCGEITTTLRFSMGLKRKRAPIIMRALFNFAIVNPNEYLKSETDVFSFKKGIERISSLAIGNSQTLNKVQVLKAEDRSIP